jgi:hypothetical protein
VAASASWTESLKAGLLCTPWVTWVMANMFFHMFWVTCLAACQIYQVFLFESCLFPEVLLT